MPSLLDVEATIDLICASNVSLLSKMIPSNFNSCTTFTGAPLRYKPENSGYFVLEREITSALVFGRVYLHAPPITPISDTVKITVESTNNGNPNRGMWHMSDQCGVISITHKDIWQVPQTNHECI